MIATSGACPFSHWKRRFTRQFRHKNEGLECGDDLVYENQAKEVGVN